MVCECTYQYYFTDGNTNGQMKNPVNRFVATKDEYNRSVWLSTTEDIHISIFTYWRTSVDSLSFVNRQYVDLVLGGTAARGAAVGGRPLLVVIPCFGKSCSRIHLNFASISISWRNEKITQSDRDGDGLGGCADSAWFIQSIGVCLYKVCVSLGNI